jgi:hypothetical protein
MRPSSALAVVWRKSSYSNPSGNCVETARLPGGRVAVRDSKRPGGPVLIFSRGEWAAFLGGLREGAAGTITSGLRRRRVRFTGR